MPPARPPRPPPARPLIAPLSLAPGAPSRQLRADEALAHARRALAGGDIDTALHIGEQLRRVPGAVREAMVLLVQVNVALSRPGDVLTLVERLLAIGVDDPAEVLAVAQGLQLTGRQAQAIGLLDATIERAPRALALRHYRAELLGEIGEQDRAVAELRDVIRREPRFFAAYRSLALLDRLGDAEVAFLERTTPPPGDRIAAWSALAFEYRHRGDPDREFHYLDQAQALLAAADPWFPAEETEMADEVIALLDRTYFEAHPPVAATGARRPLFVLGMPRSGSTLTEQILASAAGVEAAGESALFPWLLLDLATRRYDTAPWPAIALRLTPEDFAGLRRDYYELIDRVYTRAPVFVDKQFTNWKYLGILTRILPEARFIHTVRDPLDSCLSTYQQAFTALGYGHDLGHLALFYRDQARVMEHWKSLFPMLIHTVEYERLIADPEAEIRALLQFCGIPWTERALRFHETRRGIRTASVAQVRRPIYRSSAGKWRAYEKHLAAARRILGC